jgi:23S rRNA pseudouridine1911/1915/1917 synthase
LPRGATPELDAALRGFRRQALHAEHLAFAHPVTGAALAFDAEPPQDFQALLGALRDDAAAHQA